MFFIIRVIFSALRDILYLYIYFIISIVLMLDAKKDLQGLVADPNLIKGASNNYYFFTSKYQ